MATAEHHEAVTEIRVLEPEKIVLTLTLEEAEALAAVTWRTAGSSTNSPRKYFDEIRTALATAGISGIACEASPRYRISQGLRFEDWEPADPFDD